MSEADEQKKKEEEEKKKNEGPKLSQAEEVAQGYGKVCPILCMIMGIAVQIGLMAPYFNLARKTVQYNDNYDKYY